MGLLVSGIFAATMSSMDSGLNKNTGFFIKNFYQPVLKPGASDHHLLKAGKITTAVLGGLIILTALKMSQLQGLSLFQWTQRVSILVGIPIVVPLFLALLVKNTPPWSAWSTVVVGFCSSLFITQVLTPEWAAAFFHVGHPLDEAAREYWRQSIEMYGNVAVCAAWFFATKLFWSATSEEHRTQVIEFYRRLNTPVNFAAEEGAHNANDARQESVVGWLCLAYGVFVTLLALIPNPLPGRLAFVGCGVVVAGIGALLLSASRKIKP
jgi:Na+/proline symporter